MRSLSMLLRLLCAAFLTVGGFAAANGSSARAAGYETLMVPSAAMGRDIPVAFLAGGPHAVVSAGRVQRRAGCQQLGDRR